MIKGKTNKIEKEVFDLSFFFCSLLQKGEEGKESEDEETTRDHG